MPINGRFLKILQSVLRIERGDRFGTASQEVIQGSFQRSKVIWFTSRRRLSRGFFGWGFQTEILILRDFPAAVPELGGGWL
ncbi:MAG: hypothetical protein IPO07_24735 [Haliscomenobacter sp.]|nr:hypothetical protein [Haliscomenobacter sp.]MBK9491646.1 hypothetical protein [Haliscomenobacter sp.]